MPKAILRAPLGNWNGRSLHCGKFPMGQTLNASLSLHNPVMTLSPAAKIPETGVSAEHYVHDINLASCERKHHF